MTDAATLDGEALEARAENARLADLALSEELGRVLLREMGETP